MWKWSKTATAIFLDENGKQVSTITVPRKELQYIHTLENMKRLFPNGLKPGIGLIVIRDGYIFRYKLVQGTNPRTGKLRFLWELLSKIEEGLKQ